eukprot:gene9404-10212_t
MSVISDSIHWKRLEEHAKTMKNVHLRTLLQDNDRCKAFNAEHDGIFLDYCRQNITSETLDMLYELAGTAGLDEKKGNMATGKHINTTEDRAVFHIALRAPREKAFYVDGENVVPAVQAVIDRIADFSDRVRKSQWLGVTGKPLTSVVSIGIGGSYLGPEFVYEALRTDPEALQGAEGRTLRFLANVDPVDIARALSGLDPETTLVIVVSKTFTTAETMLNARTLKRWLLDGLGRGHSEADIIQKHMVAVSSAISKAVDFGIKAENVFGFWDWVGGRYSVCSAVGVLPLALQYGIDVVKNFLAGAHNMDAHFFEAPLRSNLPVLLGLLGVWNASFLGYPSRAILPYSQALVRFPAHIQQLDMESNGKRVNINGVVLPFETGEIIFGEPGTNGQHSFYQLMHQGRVIPTEFIGFSKSPQPVHLPGEAVSNHDELMSNFFAQPDALALGKTVAELVAEGVPPHLQPHKEFPGNRPSVSLLFPELNAYRCGQLLALYEHRVAVQGFIWGVNSFDQWGVELGKVLATKVRQQLAAAHRTGNLELDGFNASTSSLLQIYLQHQS